MKRVRGGVSVQIVKKGYMPDDGEEEGREAGKGGNRRRRGRGARESRAIEQARRRNIARREAGKGPFVQGRALFSDWSHFTIDQIEFLRRNRKPPIT